MEPCAPRTNSDEQKHQLSLISVFTYSPHGESLGLSLPTERKAKTLIRIGWCSDFLFFVHTRCVDFCHAMSYISSGVSCRGQSLVWAFTRVTFGAVRVETAHLRKLAGAVAALIIDKCMYQDLINPSYSFGINCNVTR